MGTDSLLSKGRVDFGIRNLGSGYTGTKTVASAGTAEKVSATSKPIPQGYKLAIKALGSNTSKVRVAFSQSDAQADSTAYVMVAGEAIGFNVSDINLLWVDAAVTGEGVTYAVEKEA